MLCTPPHPVCRQQLHQLKGSLHSLVSTSTQQKQQNSCHLPHLVVHCQAAQASIKGHVVLGQVSGPGGKAGWAIVRTCQISAEEGIHKSLRLGKGRAEQRVHVCFQMALMHVCFQMAIHHNKHDCWLTGDRLDKHQALAG
jgi:hypothetical protein